MFALLAEGFLSTPFAAAGLFMVAFACGATAASSLPAVLSACSGSVGSSGTAVGVAGSALGSAFGFAVAFGFVGAVFFLGNTFGVGSNFGFLRGCCSGSAASSDKESTSAGADIPVLLLVA